MNPSDSPSRDRKAEHIRIALDPRMQARRSFFDDWSFGHDALPEIDRASIDLSTRFQGQPLRAPLLISCMTGGTESAAEINRNLAIAAEECGVALGVGSQRKALETPGLSYTFQVREFAPTAPLLANLGAVQLNYGYGVEQCQAAVDMIRADALVLHLNVLQEAIQPEGQCDFSGLLPKIRQVVEGLSVPVIVKEIGCGISGAVGRRLAEHGVRCIDCAGQGGTSWARIEGERARDDEAGSLFADWGIPTPDAIRELAAIEGLTVIGSGGVRHGVDAAKCLALGASLVGMAYRFLEAAVGSSEAVSARIRRTVEEIRTCMFCLGAQDLAGLAGVELRQRVNR